MNSKLIAPCGMNCALCIGYIREKNRCPGCRKTDAYESSYGRKCIIRDCNLLRENKCKYCSTKCKKFPCQRLKSLDKRYRTKYKMSMIENLENIQESGIRKFIKNEKVRWKCKKCGNVLCVHRNFCLKCGYNRNKD